MSIASDSEIKQASKTMLACPFCGSEKVKITELSRGKYYQGLCNKCFGRGPKTHDLESAIKKWNERELALGNPGFALSIDKTQLEIFLKGEIALQCNTLLAYTVVLNACKDKIPNLKKESEEWLQLWFRYGEQTVVSCSGSITDKNKPWFGYSNVDYFKKENIPIKPVKLDWKSKKRS